MRVVGGCFIIARVRNRRNASPRFSVNAERLASGGVLLVQSVPKREIV